MSRFTEIALRLAQPSWTVETVRRVAAELQRQYVLGAESAAALAESWGREANAHGGAAFLGYDNLASSIRTRYDQEN